MKALALALAALVALTAAPRPSARQAPAHRAAPTEPVRPKALYLSIYGIGDAGLRGAALALADATQINALVIDVKGDRGFIAFPSANPLAREVGAQSVITMRDLPALVTSLHERGLYLIARVVVFRDNALATARPDLAVHREDGALYRDGQGLAWTDPFNRDVWTYDIGVAVEAAHAGFDEIQFDYVRLPDAKGLRLAAATTEAGREAAVDGFLTAARHALASSHARVAADVFGYVCWNENDTGIGQRLEHIAAEVDYVSPMLYPSGFQDGIPGYRDPVAHPYEVVRLSLERAIARTHLPARHFRPWLQAFADYAFGGGAFTNGEVGRQVSAAEAVGTDGWMLWNPRNQYRASDLAGGDELTGPRFVPLHRPSAGALSKGVSPHGAETHPGSR